MRRIGVFVCWCGSNIAGTVNIEEVVEAAREMPFVAYAADQKYTCSDPGQQNIIDAVREHDLDAVVVAACSPTMHEPTFRRAVEKAGLNPYLLEIANIREHCSWIHDDMDVASPKATDIVRRAVAKVAFTIPLHTGKIPITPRALVIGGGVAGIQAALDIADAGKEVLLVERNQSIGGKMAQLDKTFPTLDCSSCILTPKMVDVANHPNIRLLSYSEVEKVDGYVGNFTVTIRQKATSVVEKTCNGCGNCIQKCPSRVPSEFDHGQGERRAIYIDFPQAIPNKPVIDREHCWYYNGKAKCQVCARVCPTEAIEFDHDDVILEEEVGAIVVATGYQQYDASVHKELGLGKYPDVISGLEFERLINASGPTEGKLKRPSDGETPKNIVFIQCVGSRDDHHGYPYCSKVCCMYTAKHAVQIHEKYKDAQAYVFYIDVRTGGKDYEEFYMKAQTAGAQYIRGRPSKVYPRGDRLVVLGTDTNMGRPVEVEADLVVLASAMEPQSDAVRIAQTVSISYNQHGFYSEGHPKLRPVETNTAGVMLAGACQGPKDIPETVAQASAAAAKVINIISKEELESEPTVAEVDQDMCSGCLWCEPVCPFQAITADEVVEWIGGKEVRRQVSSVNPGLCQGCGSCVVACRSGAVDLLGTTNEQVLAEVDALCRM